MADGVVAAVVPSQAAEHSPAAASRTSTRVPLAELAPPGRQPGGPCAVAAVDARGRVSDRTVVQFLGWVPGQRIDIRAVSGSVVIRASTDGVFTLTAQGYVRLPATVRHWCALRPAEKVLLVPEPGRDALVLHTMSTVETLVREHHTGLWAGER